MQTRARSTCTKMTRDSVFDACTKEYEKCFEKNKFAYLSEVEALRGVVLESNGLEIGVGIGRFAKSLEIGIGIDPLENMLKVAGTMEI